MFVEACRLHTIHSIYIKHDETQAGQAQPVDEAAPQYDGPPLRIRSQSFSCLADHRSCKCCSSTRMLHQRTVAMAEYLQLDL
jgi:hypothetical protein